MESVIKSNIEVKFLYETVDEASFHPTCTVFYTKDGILHNLSFKASSTFLNDRGHYSVGSFLEDDNIYLTRNLLRDGTPTIDSDIEIIQETTPEITQEKNKLKGILRKQKIEKILN